MINAIFCDPCSQRAGFEFTGPMGVDVVKGELPALQLDPEVLDGLKYLRSLPAKQGLGKI